MNQESNCQRPLTAGESFELLKSRVTAADQAVQEADILSAEYSRKRDDAVLKAKAVREEFRSFIKSHFPFPVSPKFVPKKPSYRGSNDEEDFDL